MPRQDTAQGLFLAVVGVFFGAMAIRYPIGTLARFGPGFFPLVVSGAILTLAAIILARSRLTASAVVSFRVRNIAIILTALGSFVLASKLVNMAAGITALVFIATLAGTSYSWKRNVAVAAALIVVALAFELLLGLRLQVI